MGDSTTTETIERMLRPKTSRWFRLDGRMTETEVLERKERFLRMVGYYAGLDKMVGNIIKRLTEKGEQFAHMIWVGRNYSKADLLRDLRAIEAHMAEAIQEGTG